MNLRLADVRLAVDGRFLGEPAELEIIGVSTDSRLTQPGDLFFALVAERDGHEFVPQAARAGAVAAVVSRPVDVSIPQIIVLDTLAALGAAARAYRQQHNIPVIGVTGSVGKTTTKEMIAAVLERKYRVLKSDKNFNNDIGLPLTLFRLKPEHTAAVLEMAMRARGEIARLAAIAKPRIGVITNTGLSHVERLGSREAIAATKAELLVDLPSDGLAVLNRDDDFYDLLQSRRIGRTVTFGAHESSDVKAVDVRIHQDGCAGATIMTQKGVMELELASLGEHNVWNALAAIAVGIEMGVSLDDAKAALEAFRSPEMRARIVQSPLGFAVIDDTYNASPSSVASSVRTLAAMNGGRKTAVLGDMLELGDFGEEAHAGIGRVAAEQRIDRLVTVGDLGRQIAAGAVEGGFPTEKISSFDKSIEVTASLKPELRSGDVVLVKGSRGMKMELVVEGLLSE